MKTILLLVLLSILPCLHAGADPIAIWTFDPADPGRDSFGNYHDLELRGEDSHFVSDDRFGGALQIGNENQAGDFKQGAMAKHHDDLNPMDAFTISMWVQAGDDFAEGEDRATLVDKKYFYMGHEDIGSTAGYMVFLRKLPTGDVRMEAELGFGAHAERAVSSRFELPPGEWRHLGFIYDGIVACRFFVDGEKIDERSFHIGGSIAPNQLPLTLGDRFGSTGARFAGRIANVRISRGEEEIHLED